MVVINDNLLSIISVMFVFLLVKVILLIFFLLSEIIWYLNVEKVVVLRIYVMELKKGSYRVSVSYLYYEMGEI